ncbi:unnamed protein product [Pleuronectes platessa]|uniref:Uncharacterized protein n=1 Tax=Pleuronectes platessa TaxID=8262 RepID=A0A9N7URS7_PLEPL|nr:unnamed protein product [Pleuronectes platessa]
MPGSSRMEKGLEPVACAGPPTCHCNICKRSSFPKRLQERGRGWLVAAAGQGTPDSNPSNHPLHISLVVSSLRRQIIPSTMNPRVPHRSALHPLLCQDLQASQYPATPAYFFLAS